MYDVSSEWSADRWTWMNTVWIDTVGGRILFTLSQPLWHEVRGRDREECGVIGLGSHSLGQIGLPCSGRTEQQDASPRSPLAWEHTARRNEEGHHSGKTHVLVVPFQKPKMALLVTAASKDSTYHNRNYNFSTAEKLLSCLWKRYSFYQQGIGMKE